MISFGGASADSFDEVELLSASSDLHLPTPWGNIQIEFFERLALVYPSHIQVLTA